MTVKSASARQSTMRQLRLTIFSKCLDDVEAWLSSSRLRLNLPRRKCCGWALSTNCSSSAFKMFQSCQHPSGLSNVDTARDLGVVIDSGLTMSDHVIGVCRSAYY